MAGLFFVVAVVAVVGVVAATLWLEVDEDDPQALTISASSTAAIGMPRCLMVSPRLPVIVWPVLEDARICGLLPEDLNNP